MTPHAPIRVDIISDVICPWCWIGARGLMLAAEADGQPLAITWRPYQLNPDTPRGGVDRKASMLARFGGDEEAMREASARVVAVAQGVGLAPNFGAITKTPNTMDAHRLILWARADGVQEMVAQVLFEAYFVHGEDLTDRQTLLGIARGCGMDGPRIAALLDSDADIDTVEAEIATAREMGVSAVPCFVIDGKFAVMGAQEPEKFKRVFAKVREQAAAG